MEYLKKTFSEKASAPRRAAEPADFPEYFGNKQEEDEFEKLYLEWTKPTTVCTDCSQFLCSFAQIHRGLPRFYFGKGDSVPAPEQLKLLEVMSALILSYSSFS